MLRVVPVLINATGFAERSWHGRQRHGPQWETTEMSAYFMRTAIMLGGCIALSACSQPGQAPSASNAADVTHQARSCHTHGEPSEVGSSHLSTTWTISVSNDGGWCSHHRFVGRSVGPDGYQVVKAPDHGQISQQREGEKTLVSYKPNSGYTGSDSFTLRYRNANIEMAYIVSVIP
jgi:hypothetical protein